MTTKIAAFSLCATAVLVSGLAAAPILEFPIEGTASRVPGPVKIRFGGDGLSASARQDSLMYLAVCDPGSPCDVGTIFNIAASQNAEAHFYANSSFDGNVAAYTQVVLQFSGAAELPAAPDVFDWTAPVSVEGYVVGYGGMPIAGNFSGHGPELYRFQIKGAGMFTPAEAGWGGEAPLYVYGTYQFSGVASGSAAVPEPVTATTFVLAVAVLLISGSVQRRRARSADVAS